jgi:branched-chain amino acid transport system ATP-binding protein
LRPFRPQRSREAASVGGSLSVATAQARENDSRVLLAATGVKKRFGGFDVLDDVSFEVGEGKLVGIVGTNGAGKSTLFAVVSGQVDADAGSITFAGSDITRLAPQRRARLGLGRTFQVPREFAHLTVRENFLVAARCEYGETLRSVFGGWPRVEREQKALRERADGWIQFLGLTRVAGESAGALSGGQKKLLELGRMLMTEPQCILLDEPFAGVNPVLVDEISQRIRDLNTTRRIAFVVIEHHLTALQALVQHLYVMDRGRVIADGDPMSVLAEPRVLEAYMGGVI